MTNETTATAIDTRTDAHRQAVAQAEAIAEMMAAASLDWDQLEALRDEKRRLEEDQLEAMQCVRHHHAGEFDPFGEYPEHEEYRRCTAELVEWRDDNGEEFDKLQEAAGDCLDQDEAEERLFSNALSVEFRSDWETDPSTLQAAEFRVVLCTGGPHVEIIGELDEADEPKDCEIYWRDWDDHGRLNYDEYDTGAVEDYCRRIVTI